jgi:ribonuclease HII
MRQFPDFSYEVPLLEEGYFPVGIDEVGRGAFARPVCVGGAAFPSLSKSDQADLLKLGINDSKKLSPLKRENLAKILKEVCKFELSFIDVDTINEIGIGKATYMGMQEVADKLSKKLNNPYFLIDAFTIPGNYNQKGIIRGDSLSISIASASIIAKVERDRLMEQLSAKFPNYGFEKHKGYGTQFHRNEIKKHGMTKQHRVVFCEKSL